jgi:hypothetical protein
VHNRLGIQVCLNRDEKESFVREAVSIAPPGEIDSVLVRILAEESRDAFQTLLKWGATVKKDFHGDPVRVKGCFSPVQPRAFIHDWCKRNNLAYVNKAYTQIVWCKARDYSDWSILSLAHPGAFFRDSQGKIKKMNRYLKSLFKMRGTHAPVAYGLEDRSIDIFLMDALNNEGWVDVFHPDTGWERVALAAQVSNGGIRIDQNGHTGFKGVFACGECAGGMHGANRLGGAMVLGGQVFGKRVGIAAAKFVGNSDGGSSHL